MLSSGIGGNATYSVFRTFKRPECEDMSMRPEDLLNKLFLFDGGSVRAEDIEFEGKTFEKGEKIYSTVDENKGIGVLVSGKAASLRTDGSRIRTLEKGDVFGAAMFFCGDKHFNATIVAYTKCIVAFIPYKTVLEIMRKNPSANEGFLRYLSDQISQLYEARPGEVGSKAERLMRFLSERANKGVYKLNFSLKDLASILGMSRAGLYRALAELESSGAVRRDKKTIYILE